jgi:monofunctional glycosyltransferase
VPERSGWRRRLLRWLLVAAAAATIAPLALIVTYRFVEPPVTPLMLIRRAQGYQPHREWVALGAVAPAMREAVVAAEDLGFCEERLGFDFTAIGHDADIWWHGGRPYGASTITMQTARNLFLWPGRSLVRKAIEAALTPLIALCWPKRRVLEIYLNIIEFGPGIFGVQAAAQHYFGKNAAALSRLEAAKLAAVLPNPLHWSPTDPNAHVSRRAASIAQAIYFGDPRLGCAD